MWSLIGYFIVGFALGIIAGIILMYVYKLKIDAQIQRTKDQAKEILK